MMMHPALPRASVNSGGAARGMQGVGWNHQPESRKDRLPQGLLFARQMMPEESAFFLSRAWREGGHFLKGGGGIQ